METVSIDLILDTLRKWVEEKHPISPELWLDAAQKLNTLSGDLQAELYEKEEKLAQFALEMHTASEKLTVAMINLHKQANPLNREIQLTKAKLKRIEETIRIAKLQARLSYNEYQRQ